VISDYQQSVGSEEFDDDYVSNMQVNEESMKTT
jgi:hypothetical protein